METDKRLPSLIEDKLYLGGVFDSKRKEVLISLGITHVLVVGKNLGNPFKDSFTYMNININDEPEENIIQYFDQTHSFIIEGKEKGGCFVHW